MDLDQMKQKYASVLTMIQQQQVQLSHLHIQDNKLFMQGEAPSEEAKNKIWDQIKAVDPDWAQELVADIRVNPDAQPTPTQPVQGPKSNRTYTVKPGDTLSKISEEIYGNSREYMKIFDANRDVLSDPNKITPGERLKIPA